MRFQSALQKFQRFTGSLWAGTLKLGGVMSKADVVTAGAFLEHACQAVGCPGRTSRRPGPGWCRRSIGLVPTLSMLLHYWVYNGVVFFLFICFKFNTIQCKACSDFAFGLV